MKGRPITPTQKQRFYALRATGFTVAASARETGISPRTAYDLDHNTGGTSGADYRAARAEMNLPDVIPLDALNENGARGLEDFEFFRTHYLGRVSMPWQIRAAYEVREWLDSDDKEYVVVNVPPGAGKSTLFTHDIPCWLICRNRSVRIIIGSRTQRQARAYALRLRRTLERTQAYKPPAEEVAKGSSVDALGVLCADYGRFKPSTGGDLWTAEEFVVAQPDSQSLEDKESTVAAYGMDTGFLGNRADLIVWDDLVDRTTLRTAEAIETQRKWWDEEAETRLEPGGLLVLQGQRMATDDLYRYCLDMTLDEDELDDDEELEGELEPELHEIGARDGLIRKYRHVIYRAHDEERCANDHRKKAPAWPDGCLLDPYRLPWRGRGGLSGLKRNKESRYRVQYQQEDVDPADVLVPRVYVDGGADPETGAILPGCWDPDRGLCEIPQGLAAPYYSIATADPSPTKFWCVAQGTWILTDAGERRVETVAPGDRVLTRVGYKRVLDAARTGFRQVLDIRLSNGTTLRTTPEHLVATGDGWAPARELLAGSVLVAANRGTRPAVAMSAVNAEIGASVGMPSRAVSPGDLRLDVRSPSHVGAVILDRQMVGVHAQRPGAEVADLGFLWDGADQRLVSQTMREAVERLPVFASPPADGRAIPDPTRTFQTRAFEEVATVDRHLASRGFDAVPTGVAPFGLRTLDHGPAFTDVHVVSITAGSTSDVYDLAIENCPEFVANGVVVHNSIQWWVYHPATKQRFLLDLIRQSMDAPDFLDWNNNAGIFSGIMEEWQVRSKVLNIPITHWIVENNAAQRFMLQYDHVHRWMRHHMVQIIPHATHLNKIGDQYGVEMLKNIYRHGQVRLPGKQRSGAREASLKLVDEVTHYPEGRYDDCLMAQWFFEFNLPNLARPKRTNMQPPWRPSWLSDRQRIPA